MKKATSVKRASPPRPSERTSAFIKDWNRLSASGRYDMRRLKKVMMLLIANEEPLSAAWKDHPLKGEWADHRECHVGGDFLLIHRLSGKGTNEQIVFVRAGTHAELFR